MEEQEQNTDFWRHWREQCRSQHCSPQEMREMWHGYLHKFFGQEPEEHWFLGGRRFKKWHATAKPGKFNPFVSLMLVKGGGLLPLVMLHLLEKQPRYGKEIMNEIQDRTRGRWASNPGVIYPMLNLMEEHGLLEGAWEDETRRTRRFYHVTTRGSNELARLKEMMKPRLVEALEILQSLLDELYATEA